jgi:hypothetical protein
LPVGSSFTSGRFFKYFWSIYFSQIHTLTMHNKLWQLHWNVKRPKNLTPWRGFEPGIFCSWGWRGDHYAYFGDIFWNFQKWPTF